MRQGVYDKGSEVTPGRNRGGVSKCGVSGATPLPPNLVTALLEQGHTRSNLHHLSVAMYVHPCYSV